MLNIGAHLTISKGYERAAREALSKIGEGAIGLEGLVRFIRHPAVVEKPILLETPNEVEGYAAEIELLKTHYKG